MLRVLRIESASLIASALQFGADQRYDFRHGDRGGGCIAPRLVFDLALFQSPLADGDAMRDADQFEIGEHDARALPAIVEQDLEPGSAQLVVKSDRGGAYHF